MADAAALQGIAEGLDDGILAGDVLEALGTPLAIEDLLLLRLAGGHWRLPLTLALSH